MSEEVTSIFMLLKQGVEYRDVENVANELRKLHQVVMAASKEQIISVVTPDMLDLMIQAANVLPASEHNVILSCQDVIEAVFRSLPPKEIFHAFFRQYNDGIHSLSTGVAYTFLHILRKTLVDHESLVNEPNLLHLVKSVADILRNPDSDASGEARRLLLVLAKHKQGMSILFPPAGESLVASAVRKCLSGDATERFRIYELVVALCGVSPEFLDRCVALNFIDSLLVELDSSDTLVQLNALEVLSSMAVETEHCRRRLYDLGVMHKLYKLLEESKSSPDAYFLFPAVIKFFGHLSRVNPVQCASKFPEFLSSVFQLVFNYHLLEVGQRLLAFDSLALVASTPAGRSVLAKFDDQMLRSMRCFGEVIREGPLEMRQRQLESLNSLFDLHDEELGNQSRQDLTEKWYDWLQGGLGTSGYDPTVFFFELFKRPLKEIRAPVAALLKKLIRLVWAHDRIAALQGFVDYIASPPNEKEADVNVMRHEIAGEVLKHEVLLTKFSGLDQERLKKFHSGGPFYKGVSSVKIETEQAG